MPGYFLDSSALVKRYHIELGTPAIQQIVNLSGNLVRISRLAVAELISAFAIEVRTRAISRDDADVFRRQFRDDIARGKFEIYSIGEVEFSLAEQLLQHHAFDFRLRALDALQLSVAMELRSRALIDYFVASDRALCDVARREGFHVINPES